jgi:hypothetical protein
MSQVSTRQALGPQAKPSANRDSAALGFVDMALFDRRSRTSRRNILDISVDGHNSKCASSAFISQVRQRSARSSNLARQWQCPFAKSPLRSSSLSGGKKAFADEAQHAFPRQGQMEPEKLEIARLKREVINTNPHIE